MDAEQIFVILDQWVQTRQANGYMPADFDRTHPLEVLPIFGMQQNRQEIFEFCKILCSQPWINPTVLEIGLGHFGSSHFLWRHIFSKVITIEVNHSRVNDFSLAALSFYKKHILDDGKSLFVIGESQHPTSVAKIYNTVDKVDLLFIDGNHSYEHALCDWLLYSPLVKPGGIVAFHDSLLSVADGQVSKLIEEIKAARFGNKPCIHNIFHSKIFGISYYIVDEDTRRFAGYRS